MTGFWYLDDMARLRKEREAIDELADRVDWLTDVKWNIESGLSIDAIIHAHGQDYPVRLTYPALFPHVPPAVRPQNKAAERWSGHQYPDGTLCLEWGPDTWHPDVLGAQLLESAYTLFDIENAGNPPTRRHVPSRHQLSPGQEARGHFTRYFLSPDLQRFFHDFRAGNTGTVVFHRHFQSDSSLAVVQEVQVADGEPWRDSWPPTTLIEERDSPLIRKAILVMVDVATDIVRKISTVEQLDEFLAAQGAETLSAAQARLNPPRYPLSAMVVDCAGTPHFLFRNTGEDTVLKVVAPVSPGCFADAPRNPEELESLKEKKVGIVGLGSLGSKVAMTLARMGVGSFVLVDQGLFLPENVVRHVLTLHNVAEYKVLAVAHLLRQLSPLIQVETSTLHLTGQESNTSIANVTRKLANCDVIIDATADPRVFNILAGAAAAKARPLIWGEVFGGGLGGLVARSRPAKDLSPHALRGIFNHYTKQHPFEDHTPPTNYDTIDDEGNVQTATDGDVSIVAGYLAQLSADALLAHEPSAFPHSVYLLGFRRGWVFEGPFHNVAIPTDHLEEKAPNATADQALTEETMGFLSSLLKDNDAGTAPS